MKRKGSLALVLLAVFFIGQAALQRGIVFNEWKKNYAPKNTMAAPGLDPQQLLFALAGFREMIAGILWVRADSFFDTGNYDAILPIIRLVTILDPHQIDVYATGMWHIGYNFTDEQSRGDRRYVPSALALGREGARKNPETYELFFETGWMWYHRIDDNPDQAVYWFQEAHKRADMQVARKNLLAAAYQRAGQVNEALELWWQLLQDARAEYTKDAAFGNRQNRDTIENNLDTLMVRMVQRGWVAANTPEGKTGNWFATGDYDVKPPFDVRFSAKATVVGPREMKVEGTWGVLPVGTRIRIILRDEDYPNAIPGGLEWEKGDVFLDPPRDRTFMFDQLFVRNRRFERRIDMSKDPTMYPFTAENYVLEFYYNPRSAPPHIQDKFGWNGEGFTDSNFLNTEIRPGARVVYWRTTMTRDQLLREGEWTDRVPVVKTPNFRETGAASGTEDIIRIPALRGQGGG